MERFIKRINIGNVDELFKLPERKTDVVGIIYIGDEQILYRNDNYCGLRIFEFLDPMIDPEFVITDLIGRKSSVLSTDYVRIGVFEIADKDNFKRTVNQQLESQRNDQNSQNTSKLIGFVDAL